MIAFDRSPCLLREVESPNSATLGKNFDSKKYKTSNVDFKIIFNCVQIVRWITKIFSLLDLECVEEVIKVNFVSFFTSNLLWTFTQAGCLQTLDVVAGE